MNDASQEGVGEARASESPAPQPLARGRILVVDDEPANLRLLERILQRAGAGTVESTTDSALVAAMVDDFRPDLILLDLHMPGLDGFAVLETLRPRLAAEYLPVLVLTADITRPTRERALSSGAKDFLTKPLDPAEVVLRSSNLLETRELHRAERLLLEDTLEASIRALSETLALVNPEGFGRGVRAREVSDRLLEHLAIESRWEIQIAAMLSQLGSITLPPHTLQRYYLGQRLTHADAVRVARLPAICSAIVAPIPRLEGVSAILRHQDARFDGKGSAEEHPSGDDLPLGSRILKLVLDADLLESRGVDPDLVPELLRERTGWYDPTLLDAYRELQQIEIMSRRTAELEVRKLTAGMVLAEDIRATNGVLLVARGQKITERIVERLRVSERLLSPRQRVHAILKDSSAPGECTEGEVSRGGDEVA